MGLDSALTTGDDGRPEHEDCVTDQPHQPETATGSKERRGSASMTWVAAYAWAIAILVVFGITVVWLPSKILNWMAGSSQLLQDLIGPGVWAVAFAGLLFGLRRAQKTGRI